MPFQAACPFCPTRINGVLERALGASTRCPQCGNNFTVAPADDIPVLVASFRKVPAAGAPIQLRNPQPAHAAKILGAGAEPLPEPAPVLAGAAETELSSAPATVYRSHIGLWVAFVSGAALVALLLAVLLWPGSRSQKQVNLVLDDLDPHLFLVVTPDNRQKIKDLGRSEWVDAATTALRQGNVHIRISWVKVDTPPAKKTAQPAKLPVSLLIQAQLSHSTPGQLDSWKGFAHDTVTPVLTDAKGTRYALRQFAPEAGVRNQVERVASASGAAVQQLLVFEPPPEDAAALKLELSAAVWGGSGTCRFRIPPSMIVIAAQASK
jgi:hypothetical protein